MLSKIIGALSLARHAIALTLVTGAATAMVAGSVDVASAQPTAGVTSTTTASQHATSNELETLVKACLATKDPQSAECAKAVEQSGLSGEEFWAKVAMSLNEQPKHETTKPATSDLLTLVSACVASHERSSAYCQRALELSGLPADEFWAKVGAMFSKSNDEPKHEQTPKPESPKTDEAVYGLIKDCLAKYENAKSSTAGPTTASEACRKAIEASGLSANDFWARFGPKHEPTKPEPTKKPETSVKPETKPTVSSVELGTLVRDCFAKYLAARTTKEGGAAAAEACNRAITASGLTPQAFWAKFGTPGAPAN